MKRIAPLTFGKILLVDNSKFTKVFSFGIHKVLISRNFTVRISLAVQVFKKSVN